MQQGCRANVGSSTLSSRNVEVAVLREESAAENIRTDRVQRLFAAGFSLRMTFIFEERFELLFSEADYIVPFFI
jgi:hypothetical protein